MHELAVTRAVLEQAVAQAKACSAKRVISVNLVIGEAASVVPECINFYFGLLSEGTIAAGARLTCRRTPVRIRCPKCGRESAGLEDLCNCNVGGELISGTEMEIESIDIE